MPTTAMYATTTTEASNPRTTRASTTRRNKAPVLRMPRPRTRGERAAPVSRARAASPGAGVRVLLIADQLLTGQAMQSALQAQGLPVLELALPRAGRELRELRQAARSFSPDVGVIVLECFDPLAVGDLERLVHRGPAVNWMVLTSCAQGPYWGALLTRGAADVLPLSIGFDALLAALPEVAGGHDLMDPADRARLGWRDQAERTRLTRLAELSPRQVQVLRELVRGKSVTEVANSRDVSVATVRSQVQAIRHKLQVPTQLAAVAEWIRASRGWPFAEEW